MSDEEEDIIGTELIGTDWPLVAYLAFAAAMLVFVGALFGAFVL